MVYQIGRYGGLMGYIDIMILDKHIIVLYSVN